MKNDERMVYQSAKKKKQTRKTPQPEVTKKPQPLTEMKALKPGVEALIILLFSVGLYVNTIGHGFVLDDLMMITHNEFTKQGFEGIGKILTNDAFTGFHGEDKNLLPGGRYRPLSQMMFAVEAGVFGMVPLPGHVINILLYALALFLMFRAMRLLFANSPHSLWKFSLPFVVTLLFAIHPLHTESVANIKGRDEILALIGFATLTILAFRFLETRKQWLLVAITLLFFLSMLSKESALTFLAAIPLLLLYRGQRFSRVSMQVIMALLAGLAMYLMLRFWAIGIPKGAVSNQELLNDPFLLATPIQRLATLFYTWIKYIGLILFPHPLTHDYYPWHIAYKSFGNGWVILSLVFFLGMAFHSVRKIRKPDMLVLGFLLFVILFSSQSNLLVNIGAFMNERFVFLALAGILIMLAWLLVEWLPARVKQHQVLSIVIFVVMVAGFSVKTVSRNRAWKDDFTLFTTDVKTSVNSAKVNVSAGGMLLERARASEQELVRQGLLNQAVSYLKRGTELHPRYVQGQLLLGNALLLQNRFAEAFDAYEACLKMNPSMNDPLMNSRALARRAFQMKDYQAAEKVYKGLLVYQPKSMELATRYAEALMYNNQFEPALKLLDSLLILAPDDADINHLQGQMWGRYLAFRPFVTPGMKMDYLNKSRRFLEKAVAGDPGNHGMVENLAIVHGLMGDTRKALELFDQALNMMLEKEKQQDGDPSSKRILNENLAKIYRNIGDTYGNMRNEESLLHYYEQSFKYNPDDGVIATTIAQIYQRRGNPAKGREYLDAYLARNAGDKNLEALRDQMQ
jgi:protein O-mannosyl-transferase